MSADAGITPPAMEGMENFSNSMKNDSGKDTVIVNFMFPANLFKSMMEDGLLEDFLMAGLPVDDNGDDSDEDDLEDDVDHRSKPGKKRIRENNIDFKEKDDESWGNSFRDWSSNPNDYL